MQGKNSNTFSTLSIFLLLFFYLVNPIHIHSQIVIKGYNHVALSVSDIEASTHFYRDIVGLQPIGVPGYMRKIRSWFKIADGQELHLLAGRVDKVTNNDPNSAHFSWSIESADPVEAHLKAKGLPYLRQQRFDGAWQIYITDPDGYVIELNEPKVNWRFLFNDVNLDGWDTYLGAPFPAVGEDRKGIAPIGLNKDPNKTFSVVQIDGAPAIRISGEHFGGLSTKESFSNYHLQMEFKWGEAKWHPREKAKRDSGVLYHANGEHGADAGFWMQSLEYQIQEGDCGDYWGLVGVNVEIPCEQKGEKEFVFNKSGVKRVFASNADIGRHCIKSPDAEFPNGEWNLIDIYCFDDMALHVINGQTVMIVSDIKYPGKDGKLVPLKSGKIQIQSEGSEVFYRNIKISPLVGSIPANLFK